MRVVVIFNGVCQQTYLKLKDLAKKLDVIILFILSTLGLSHLLGKIPFMFTIPIWMEASMIPLLLASFLVWVLFTIAGRVNAKN